MLSDDKLTYIIAVSESTPGPIMLNVATYVGLHQAGILGGILATSAVILPSFIIILLITAIFSRLLKTALIQSLLKGLKPGIVGIICATGLFMAIQRLFFNTEVTQKPLFYTSLFITIVIAAVLFVPKYLLKKNTNPFVVIILSAILGIVLF